MSTPYVATVVAGQAGALTETALGVIADYFKRKGVTSPTTVWQVPGQVADLFFESESKVDAPQTDSADVIVQPVEGRRKKLLVADMESTIIEQEMLDELAATIGMRDKVAEITARAMNGELDFGAALKERVALLRDLPVTVLDDVAKNITLMPGAERLLHGMRAMGGEAWLVSGGFTYFAKPVAEKLGFKRVFANDLEIRSGKLTGRVREPYLDKSSKRILLLQACKELRITPAESAAIGDGANDIPMLVACNEAGGLGVAFHAKPNVRAVVPHQINHGDLSVMLHAQGLGCQ